MAAPDKALVFDLSGPFAHYKKIFATTTALTYPIPPKTSLYGLLGAILGLEKTGNDYLKTFPAGRCRMALQLLRPVRTQRISMNLRPSFGSLRATENRKPTLMEFVDRPKYRVYCTHADPAVYDRLRELLAAGKSTYTPTLGLANLIAKIEYRGEARLTPATTTDVDSVIPKSKLTELHPFTEGRSNRLMEVGQYAVEMLPSRDVTVRDNLILDRNGAPIAATVADVYRAELANATAHVVLF